MKSKLLTVVLFLFLSLGFFGQEQINFRYIDSTTYQLYIQQDWPTLNEICKLGLKNDIDYFYLRMRKGIAEFEEEKYHFAIGDFEKALQFNAHDKTAKTYTYNSLKDAGKSTRANRFARDFSEQLKQEIGFGIITVESVDFYAGYMFSNNFNKNGVIDLLQDGEANFGEQMLLGNQVYLHSGLQLNFSPSISLYGGFSLLNIDKRNRYQYILGRYNVESVQHGPQGGYLINYELVEENFDTVFNDNINQEEIYLNGKLQLDKGWAVDLYANLLFIQLTKHEAMLDSTLQRDIQAYNAQSNRYVFVDHLEYHYNFRPSDSAFVNWVVGFNLQKDFNFLLIDLAASYSKINNSNPFQTSLSVSYFPFGNFDFYGKTGLVYLNQSPEPIQSSQRLIFQQMIGAKLTGKIWLEGEFVSGNLQNANINQASVVFNLPEKINYLAGLKLHIFVSKHIAVSLMYDFMDKTGYYFNNAVSSSNYSSYTTQYQTHNIIGGIKWTP